MTEDLTQAIMASRAARHLPARLDVAATTKLLGFVEHDIQALMGAGKLTPLGDPAPNAPKWFCAVEVIQLATDREWLHKATRGFPNTGGRSAHVMNVAGHRRLRPMGRPREGPGLAAMAAWTSRGLRARRLAVQVTKQLNCSTEDVAILVTAGKLRALGKPRPNAVKFFSSIELISQFADPDWLDEATRTIGLYWKRKNARRNGWRENPEQAVSEVR